MKSLWNRRFVAGLTVFSLALSVALILGVERLRSEAKAGFANSASGIDLIVAARGNPVQILLATVFGVGSTGNGLSWGTFEMVEALPQVTWAVPISMGDNHRGFPVIGTSADYFERFRHSGGKSLEFAAGDVFLDGQDAVIGSELANRLDYTPGAEVVLAHGSGSVAFDLHDEAPFRVVGVLAPTGTAVDRMVFVPLEGFDRLHTARKPTEHDPLKGPGGAQRRAVDTSEASRNDLPAAGQSSRQRARDDKGAPGADVAAEDPSHGHEPDTINAIYVGLSERAAVLAVQRALSTYPAEALTAVMPNVALLELWSITGTAETALQLMAAAVVLAGLVGMTVMLCATLEARRREFGILRSVGAPPARIFSLIVLEAATLTVAGLVLGYVLLTVLVLVTAPFLADSIGLRLAVGLPSADEITLLVAILFCGVLASILPAARVYRMTLADGLALRI